MSLFGVVLVGLSTAIRPLVGYLAETVIAPTVYYIGMSTWGGVERVSAIVPTRDDDEHLRGAVNSVLAQDVEDVAVEVVLVDSGASGLPARIAEGDDRVRYVWADPDGVAAARNRGIDHATGDVIGFCDADDYWLPGKLSAQLPLIREGADIVYSDESILDGGGRYRLSSLPVVDPERHHIDFFREGGVGSRSVLVRSELLDRERFDERFVVREDPHLWTRLFAETDRIARVGDALSVKRRRPDSLTSDPHRVYRMRRLEIADLCQRYPELRPYRGERLRRARTVYAKHWLEGLPVGGRALHAAQHTLWTMRAVRRSFS